MRLIDKLRRGPGRGRDEGFTLIELVMSVSILGIIIVPLTGVVIEYFLVDADTRARLSESTDQQFISTYWQQDVSSLGKRSFAPGATDPVPSATSVEFGPVTGCGSSAGTVVVRFSWTEFEVGASDPALAWSSVAHEAAYVKSGTELSRVRCRGGVEESPLRMAHNLDGAPVVACDPDPCPTGATLPRSISMTFTVRDVATSTSSIGYTTTVTADRRQG
ncbi:prepilin-type N-terminal cleavage/methylation domain-containing protein [Nocardioides sp.]|uniref:PulJ/GspJ family protein n=1 Tax=Nocardioides sp. TaxID=35761 RepID=UPI002C5281F6|nr:prepilin-type N-terminal cleavage/methylation domain-containing protein [Nocardioides sp.]HSX66083.1 prepilin-type N-terminal cleavage/methylation domain-containing protein [Nocardioides sp.]